VVVVVGAVHLSLVGNWSSCVIGCPSVPSIPSSHGWSLNALGLRHRRCMIHFFRMDGRLTMGMPTELVVAELSKI